MGLDPRPAKSDLSEALFALHEAAMDAANNPTRETLNAVRKAARKVDRLISPFYWEESKRLEAAAVEA